VVTIGAARINKTIRSIRASEQEWVRFRAWCLERGWTLGEAIAWFISLTQEDDSTNKEILG
jgi:hypothetical protein